MEYISSQKSLARWCRQLCFMPYFQQRWLNHNSKRQLTQAIATAEQDHFAEIVLIIENTLPLISAYQQDCRERAIDLFGLYRVWDTEYNSGILVYLNLCEHQLHIIADRGIHTAINPTVWQELCTQTLDQFKQHQHIDALVNLLTRIAHLLKQYHIPHQSYTNELPNQVIHLR